MGSDRPPQELVTALASFEVPKEVKLLVIGTPDVAAGDLPFYAAPEFVSMDDSPLMALRRKKKASLFIGLKLLKEKKIDAFISAGNTGAYVTGAKFYLPLVSGIIRPALAALVPTEKKPVAVLDVGAFVQAKAVHLVQYARMGAAYMRSLGCEMPRVGLLNIGAEAIKGTSEQRLAYHELQQHPSSEFHFLGNIEGKVAFDGGVDVLVTDGFTGNVFLKTAEGIASFILNHLAQGGQNDAFLRHLTQSQSPGALLLGVVGIAIKCHGDVTPTSLLRAVEYAASLKNLSQ
ncbi:MAG: phosphate acyltransferase [Chlamydiota bacterium]